MCIQIFQNSTSSPYRFRQFHFRYRFRLARLFINNRLRIAMTQDRFRYLMIDDCRRVTSIKRHCQQRFVNTFVWVPVFRHQLTLVQRAIRLRAETTCIPTTFNKAFKQKMRLLISTRVLKKHVHAHVPGQNAFSHSILILKKI